MIQRTADKKTCSPRDFDRLFLLGLFHVSIIGSLIYLVVEHTFKILK